jgi:hypothetical protein
MLYVANQTSLVSDEYEPWESSFSQANLAPVALNTKYRARRLAKSVERLARAVIDMSAFGAILLVTMMIYSWTCLHFECEVILIIVAQQQQRFIHTQHSSRTIPQILVQTSIHDASSTLHVQRSGHGTYSRRLRSQRQLPTRCTSRRSRFPSTYRTQSTETQLCSDADLGHSQHHGICTGHFDLEYWQ